MIATAPLRIMGIDPGSRRTGVGLIDCDSQGHTRHVHHATIACHDADFPTRLRIIFEQLSALIGEFQPTEVAVEKVFMARNPDSALKLGQARGAAICAAVAAGVSVAEYSATQIKQAVVGGGRADKAQVQYMIGILLRPPQPPQEDAADALAVALTHAHVRGSPQNLLAVRRR